VGVSRNTNSIPLNKLENSARDALEPIARRAMVVVNPLRVVLSNCPEAKSEELKVPNHPKDESKGTHGVRFGRVIFIDRADFREDPSDQSYFGLAPGREVHLKYAFNIKCVDFVKGKDGQVEEVRASVDFKNDSKPKGKIHWVGPGGLTVELRLYEQLFKDPDPMKIKENWLSNINPKSLVVVKNALADPSVGTAVKWDKFQFERVGFFNTDDDSAKDHLIFNLTVGLKEAKDKQGEQTEKTKPKAEKEEKKSKGGAGKQ